MGPEAEGAVAVVQCERVAPMPGSTPEQLWHALTLLAGQPFRTSKGLEFTYAIRGNEMFVSRKEKSITKATVLLAYRKALSLGERATGPKTLGCFGASYLYPIFRRLGVIRLPLVEAGKQ